MNYNEIISYFSLSAPCSRGRGEPAGCSAQPAFFFFLKSVDQVSECLQESIGVRSQRFLSAFLLKISHLQWIWGLEITFLTEAPRSEVCLSLPLKVTLLNYLHSATGIESSF